MTRVAVVDAGAGARGAATENEGVDDGSNLTTSPSHQPAPGETSGRDADAAVEPEVHSGEESEAESVPPLGYASSDDASTAEPDLGDDSDDASLQPLADDGLVSLAPPPLRSEANAPDPGFENSWPPRPHRLTYGWGIRTGLTYPETTRQPPPEERREDDADQP
jgi:hypothetical protein